MLTRLGMVARNSTRTRSICKDVCFERAALNVLALSCVFRDEVNDYDRFVFLSPTSLLTWGGGKIHNNLQRILHHWHILYHVLIHIQDEFKLYTYIWLSKGDLVDFLNLAHFSNQTVLLGWNEINSHRNSCFNFILSQASGIGKHQQLC